MKTLFRVSPERFGLTADTPSFYLSFVDNAPSGGTADSYA